MTREAQKLLDDQSKQAQVSESGRAKGPMTRARLAKTISFVLDTSKVNRDSRTPREQAECVVRGASNVCWSAHMADRARHVIMKVDVNVEWNADLVFWSNFAVFKTKWASLMTTYGLQNWKGGNEWGDGDAFHFELKNSKIAQSDKRAEACLEEYARLTREEGKKKNISFEKSYEALLKPHLKKFEKPAGAARLPQRSLFQSRRQMTGDRSHGRRKIHLGRQGP
jgi:hypothetical protein